jgi:hypothetical protein
VGFAVVGIVFCIEEVVGFVVLFVSIGKVVVFAVVVVVYLSNLWSIEEGFGRMGQPVNMSGESQIKTNL